MDDVHEFCRRVRPRLCGTVVLLVGDPHVAEELAQDALARVWAGWVKLAPLDEAARCAWAYRVAVNLANSWWRRRGAERRALDRYRLVDGQHAGPPDAADVITIRSAIRALPTRQRTAVVLRYYTDLPVDEVAALMGCAPGTVKALTSQALHRLRSVVGELEEA